MQYLMVMRGSTTGERICRKGAGDGEVEVIVEAGKHVDSRKIV